MAVSAPHCFTCRHWLEGVQHVGECHRYPPAQRGDFAISRRNDWCGEHQDKHAGREDVCLCPVCQSTIPAVEYFCPKCGAKQ